MSEKAFTSIHNNMLWLGYLRIFFCLTIELKIANELFDRLASNFAVNIRHKFAARKVNNVAVVVAWNVRISGLNY